MAIKVTLGEPLWRDLGIREVLVEPTEAEREDGVALPALIEELGVGGGLRGEAGMMVILNERIVPPAEHGEVRFRNEDHVVLQVMMAGG